MAVERHDEKEPDLDAIVESDAAVDGEAPRRRKRRAMRVPSDDVPRPSPPAAASAVVSQPVHVESEIEFDVDVDPPSDGDEEMAAEEIGGGGANGHGGKGEEGLEIDVDVGEAVGERGDGIVPVHADDPEHVDVPVHADEHEQGHAHANVDVDLEGDDLEEVPETVGAATAVSVPVSTPPSEASAPMVSTARPETLGSDENPVPTAAPDDVTAPVVSEPVADELELSSIELEEEHGDAPEPPRPPAPPPAASKPPAPPPKPPPPRLAAAAAAVLEPRPKRRRTRAWFEEIFDEDYLRTLPFLTPQTTQREAAFLIDGLAVKPGHHVLDIGCGYGRHAMELAARGFHVLALDLSLPLLLRGADEAQRRGLSINFVHADMRELAYDGQFDGAYCVFSTFGFFDDDTNKRVAQGIARSLKPGGRFILDILNRDYIISDLPTRVWWEGDGCVVLEEVDFNYFNSRILSQRQIVFEDGRQLEQEISIRAYSLHEVGKLLHGAGFRVLQVSGGMAARGRFFGKDSRQIIVVAEKRTDGGRDGAPAPDTLPYGSK